MMPWCQLVLICLVVTFLPSSSAELIDLSYTFAVDSPDNPLHSPFILTPVDLRAKNQKWKVNNFCGSEHSGTHVDAPNHFDQNGLTLEAIPTSKMWRRPGVVVDVRQAISRSTNKNYEVRVADLEAFENTHGIIPDGAIVFIRTGQAAKVMDINAYSGINQHRIQNYPGLGKGAAEWLAGHKAKHDHREGIVGVGVDTLSLDKGTSEIYPAHIALFKHNIYGIENVANLDKLPQTGFYVTVMPMRIGGGSGAPARVVAELGDTVGMHAAGPPRLAACLALLLTALASICLL